MIEPARYEDLDTLAAMAVEFFGDSLSPSGLFIDTDSTADFFYQIIDGEDSVMFVSRGAEIEGAIAGYVAPWQYNRNIMVLNELFWFVPERNRGDAFAGGLLVRKLLKWGKARGATSLMIVSNMRAESPRVTQFYERMGARLTDTVYTGRL
jgi:hypothetical protein